MDGASGAWGSRPAEQEDTNVNLGNEITADSANGDMESWGSEAVDEEEANASKDNEIPLETAMEEVHLTGNNEETRKSICTSSIGATTQPGDW